MNREQWAKLSPACKRAAVALACGWKQSIVSNYVYQLVPPDGDGTQVCCCPDYLNDLNAMHEAEKVIGGNHNPKWADYCAFLDEVVDFGGVGGSKIAATAEQRAEAFVLTMGVEIVVPSDLPEEDPGMPIPPDDELTCFRCDGKDICKYAWDPYNTNGDCLANK